MQPDAQRQWFVYFREKETGPISEKELHSKIRSGELDASAYVFTEGMSDWALVSDTPVLSTVEDLKGFSDESSQAKSKLSQSQVASTGTQSRAPATAAPANPVTQTQAPKTQTQAPTGQTQSGVARAPDAAQFKNLATNTKTASPKSQTVDATKPILANVKASKDKTAALSQVDLKDPGQRRRLLVLLSLLVFAAVGGGIASGLIAIPNLTELAGPKDTGKEPIPTAPVTDLAPKPITPPVVETSVDWESALQQFRLIKDPKGSVAMIARASIGAKFPIFVGSLSPLLTDIRELSVAVYPDNEKNLMALPRLWYFRVPVQDGWFTIGPLSNGGAPLSAGRYVITLMSQGKAFDDQVIDVGTWPSEPELLKIRTQLDQDRLQASIKEKADFGPRVKSAIALEKQLLVRSVDARKQKKGRSAWTSFSRAWYKDIEAQIKVANQVSTGPTFYLDAQRKLAAYLDSLRGLYETYEIVSKEGTKGLKKAGRKTEEQQRMQMTRLNTELSALGASLKAPEKIEAFKLDPNMVKESLKTFEQSAKELTQ